MPLYLSNQSARRKQSELASWLHPKQFPQISRKTLTSQTAAQSALYLHTTWRESMTYKVHCKGKWYTLVCALNRAWIAERLFHMIGASPCTQNTDCFMCSITRSLVWAKRLVTGFATGSLWPLQACCPARVNCRMILASCLGSTAIIW